MARFSIHSLVLRVLLIAAGATAVTVTGQAALAEDAMQERDVKAVKEFLAKSLMFKGKTWETGPTRITNKSIETAYPKLRFYYVFSSAAARRADKSKLDHQVFRLNKRGGVGFFSHDEGLMKIGSSEDAKIAAAANMSLQIGRNGPLSIEANDVKASRTDENWVCRAAKNGSFFEITFDRDGKFVSGARVDSPAAEPAKPASKRSEAGDKKKVYYTVDKSAGGGAIVVLHNTSQGDVRCDEIPASKLAKSGFAVREAGAAVGVVVIFHRDGKVTAVKLEQQPVPGLPDAATLIKDLSDPRSDVRASAAEALRSLLAADPASAPNCHKKAYWEKRVAQLKAGMTLEDALKLLLPELSPSERRKTCQGGPWSGASGSSVVRLDDYWTVTLYLVDFEHQKLHEHAPDLNRAVRPVWVEAPKGYTGVWVTWYVNGQKSHEIQYRDGQYDGPFTAFHDDGSKSYEQHYSLGVCRGTDTGWHRNGKKAYEGQYEHGEQTGTWRWWNDNGQIESTRKYKAGKLVGEKDGEKE